MAGLDRCGKYRPLPLQPELDPRTGQLVARRFMFYVHATDQFPCSNGLNEV